MRKHLANGERAAGTGWGGGYGKAERTWLLFPKGDLEGQAVMGREALATGHPGAGTTSNRGLLREAGREQREALKKASVELRTELVG